MALEPSTVLLCISLLTLWETTGDCGYLYGLSQQPRWGYWVVTEAAKINWRVITYSYVQYIGEATVGLTSPRAYHPNCMLPWMLSVWI
jgi:hypothetical protein